MTSLLQDGTLLNCPFFLDCSESLTFSMGDKLDVHPSGAGSVNGNEIVYWWTEADIRSSDVDVSHSAPSW